MLNINQWIRQGDVIITRIENNNQELGNKMNAKTLALGEMTGHHHSFTRGNDQVLIYGDNNENPQYLKVESDTALLTHQEHSALEIPKGVYKIEMERTYNYFDKAIKKVVD